MDARQTRVLCVEKIMSKNKKVFQDIVLKIMILDFFKVTVSKTFAAFFPNHVFILKLSSQVKLPFSDDEK